MTKYLFGQEMIILIIGAFFFFFFFSACFTWFAHNKKDVVDQHLTLIQFIKM